MATISGTSTGNGQAGSTWSATVNIDTSTGESTATVTYNTPTGSITLTGTPESISTQLATKIEKFAAYPPYVELLTLAQKGLLEQSATLTEQYKQLVPDAKTPAEVEAAAVPTNTDQQNKAYVAAGGANDDSGSTSNSPIPPAIATAGLGSSSPIPPAVANAGTTVAGKSDTPLATAPNKPQPGKRLQNPLGNFSSYTYQISLYMITPDAYAAFIESSRKKIDAFQDVDNTGNGVFLIAQSGGINNTGIKRAPGFDLDFYIDDLKMIQAISGKDTGAATNTTDISFTITEPYGFSFLTRLKKAQDDLAKVSKSKNFEKLTNPSKQFFILGIRFQGYDEKGNLISSKNMTGSNSDPAGNAYGVYERYFDIVFKSLKFKIEGKAVTYSITAASAPSGTIMGFKNGIVWNGASVKGATVDQLLMGSSDGTLGLLAKLNADQKQLLDDGAITIANHYSVKYLGDAEKDIKDSSIISKADLDKLKFAPAPVKNSGESTQANSDAQPDPSMRQVTFPSGTPILQCIDMVIKQSQYLESALQVVYDSVTDSSDANISQKSAKNIKWYNIGVEMKSLGWDDKQKDFRYDITYVIQPYETPVTLSAYANKATKYYGPHKRYEYWYTGKNSEILKYEQTMDNTYFTSVVGDKKPIDSAASGGDTDSAVIAGQPQNQPKQGKLNNETQNNYMTSLYDPGAYAEAKIQILGDPDFLMQTNPISDAAIYNQFYGTDGYTVNPNGGQVFIEINFKEPVDYNNQTGKLDINESIIFWKYPGEVQADIDKRGGGVSYMVKTCTSTFRGGQFIQDISAVINTFSEATAGTKGQDAGREANQTAATAARTGVNLSTDAAAQATAQDPRLAGSGGFVPAQPTGTADTAPSKQPTTQSSDAVNTTSTSTQITSPVPPPPPEPPPPPGPRSVTVNGYTFVSSGPGRVIVKGPGIPSYGIDIGYASDLSPKSFINAATGPNTSDAANAALIAFGQDPQVIGTIQSGFGVTPSTPAPANNAVQDDDSTSNNKPNTSANDEGGRET